MAHIVVNGKLPKNPIVIEGFPSKGFVSTIAANYMIREMGMKLAGFIDADEVGGIAVIKDSKPLRPVRIYVKDNFVLIYSEVTVPFNCIPKFSKVVNEWLEKLNPSMVVLMAGITGVEADKDHEILGVATTPALAKRLETANVKMIKDGVLTGVSSNILLHCVENNIPTIGLMVQTEYTPDALAAASMLDILNRLLGVKVSVENLRGMGKDVEEEFKKIIKQMRKGKEGYVNMEDSCPMYG